MTRVYYSLYDRMLSKERLQKAFLKVKSAKGAAGVDGQTIEDFSGDLQKKLDMLVEELRDKSYRPLPVKRVEIPKAGGGKQKTHIVHSSEGVKFLGVVRGSSGFLRFETG